MSRCTRRSADAWRVDRVTVGTVLLDASGPEGAVVRLTAAEFIDGNGRPKPNEHDSSVAFTLDGTRRVLESFDYYGGHGVLVDAPDDVTVHARHRAGAAASRRGRRLVRVQRSDCSTTICAVGRRSVTINSFDAYTDCPTREQRAWTGDSVVHQMVDLTTNFDWRLAHRHPALTAVPRPDGMLPMAVAGDIEGGDLAHHPGLAAALGALGVEPVPLRRRPRRDRRSLLGVVEGVVRWFVAVLRRRRPADRRLRLGDHRLVGDIHRRRIRRVVRAVGPRPARVRRDGRRGWATAAAPRGPSGRHARLKRASSSSGTRSASGTSTPSCELRGRVVASQHGQAAAIVGGLAPPRRIARVWWRYITDRSKLVHATFSVDGPADPDTGEGDGPVRVGGDYLANGHPEQPWWDEDLVVTAQPFFRYVVHDALVAAGRSDLIVDQCRDWEVALHRCDTSWTECWFGGTVSHAWSSTPTRDLIQRVLGVTPAEPGFGVARIDPHLADLDWARATVPTPFGVRVAVDRTKIEIDSPVPFDYAAARHDAGTHWFPR